MRTPCNKVEVAQKRQVGECERSECGRASAKAQDHRRRQVMHATAARTPGSPTESSLPPPRGLDGNGMRGEGNGTANWGTQNAFSIWQLSHWHRRWTGACSALTLGRRSYAKKNIQKYLALISRNGRTFGLRNSFYSFKGLMCENCKNWMNSLGLW